MVLVDQWPYLVNSSIAENVLYSRPESTRAQIEKAGREASLDEMIQPLPEGYDTKTGERGLAVSVGERQRIMLARALLRNPSVLILDELISALHPETEWMVAQNLRQSLHGRAVIVITHRPAPAEIADTFLHLRDGKIVTELALA
jgi:ATP-binding cassette, subfamily B, bacterial